jgi:integrase
MKVWDTNQLRRFLEEASSQRLFGFWRLAATTGARRGELLGLGWKEVDLDAVTVTISRQRVRGPAGVTWGSPKTERGRRTLDIDPGTVVILREWRLRELEERLALGEAYEDHGLVACRENGAPLDPDVASQSFRRLSRSAGLPLVRFHDLRHTQATLLLKEGVAAHVVSQRLGHASVGFTLQTYAHILPQQQAEAVARLAAAIGG